MLSLQYLNKRLKKSHIEQIQNNYNIKYTTMKKEIENKINIMIKTFNDDISAFLNNMQDVAEQKQQLKSLENKESEVESLREKIKDSIHEKTKLRREIELLRIENNRLKYYSNTNGNVNSSRKKLFSPSATSRENPYQPLNTVSNFHSSLITSPKNKPKDNNSILIKTEKKEKKERKEKKDSRLFKSPQIEQLKKTKKQLSISNVENNKTKGIDRKKEKTKTLLSFSTSQIINKKNNLNYGSSKNLMKKNKITYRSNKDFNKTTNNSLLGKKILNVNKKETTKSSFNQKKELSKTKIESENFVADKIKQSEEYSSEKYSSSSSEESNKSKISIEYNDDEEQTMIDDEISEMNFIEEEILSVMEQIKEFKDQNFEINGNNENIINNENFGNNENLVNNENIINNGLT